MGHRLVELILRGPLGEAGWNPLRFGSACSDTIFARSKTRCAIRNAQNP